MTVLPNRVRGLLTDTVLTRLRRESRDARKNRYSARHRALSTKSVKNHAISIIFFCSVRKNHYEMNHSPVLRAPQVKTYSCIAMNHHAFRAEKNAGWIKSMAGCLPNFILQGFDFAGPFIIELELTRNGVTNAGHEQSARASPGF
jgi:hypothetical protein